MRSLVMPMVKDCATYPKGTQPSPLPERGREEENHTPCVHASPYLSSSLSPSLNLSLCQNQKTYRIQKVVQNVLGFFFYFPYQVSFQIACQARLSHFPPISLAPPHWRCVLSPRPSSQPLGSILGCLRWGSSDAAAEMMDRVKVIIYQEAFPGRGIRKGGRGGYQAKSHRVALREEEVILQSGLWSSSGRDEQGAGAVYILESSCHHFIRPTPTSLPRM